MTLYDKTYCASPDCKNECGRKMTEKDKKFLAGHPWYPVAMPIFAVKHNQTKRRNTMVDCKECSEYVHNLLNRGDITKDDIDRIILDRHILKGCDKKQKIDPFKDWLEFAIENQKELRLEHAPMSTPEWNKGYMEALKDAKERYSGATVTNDGTN